MGAPAGSQVQAQPIRNTLAPGSKGPQAVKYTFSTSISSPQNLSVQPDVAWNIKNLQSIFIDNSENADAATLVINSSGEVLTVPAYAQGTFPLFYIGELLQITCTTSGGVDVPVMFLNISLPLAIWFAQNPPISGAVTVQGTVSIGTPPPVSNYGNSQTPVANASANQSDAQAQAALPAVANKTNYITSAQIMFTGATAAGTVLATLAGILGGTMSIPIGVPAGVNAQGTPVLLEFDPPLPANAVNTAITLTLPALGAGNVNAAVSLQGFYQ